MVTRSRSDNQFVQGCSRTEQRRDFATNSSDLLKVYIKYTICMVELAQSGDKDFQYATG